ncbi:DUF4012 domain-containing protein [Sphaerisporangium corydalis]|uniref:DUF4012 domain-containing protein n=1 Tax=Sphaerisporangium corydalis TaxID=1441875 RepID=A0ABV9EP82_9ACTN|nr:DUF4012 domain-containing protein [Sphaerisporangium corydalis]
MAGSGRRKILLTLPPAAGAGLVLAGCWSAHLALSTRDHLEAVRDGLFRLRATMTSGDAGRMSAAIADARAHAAEARRLTSGPAWWTVARLPVVGDAATTMRGLAVSAAELTGVLADVQRAGAPFLTMRKRSLGDMRRLLADLDAAAPVLTDAASRLGHASAVLAATPADTGAGSLNQARNTALREIDGLRARLGDAATGAALLPPMLGHTGERRYFLAFQTNAEARGTGGLVGAFGLLTARHGKIRVTGLSANTGLAVSSAAVADHGPAYLGRYGPSATKMLSISNLSPHFPYAAVTWTGLWEREAHQRLDGALAIDPVGMAGLLEVIGPVSLPGGEAVTSANVVDLTERAAYARYSDPMERKRFLITIAEAVAKAIPRTSATPSRILPVLTRMAGERRIQIWSRRDVEESRLAGTPLGGVLPERQGPYAGLVVNNSAGGKLDYYLEREVDYRLGPCRDGTRATRVRIRLTNAVPGGPLPGYVTGRLDTPSHPPAVGSNRSWVSLYASVGSRLSEARIDGERTRMIEEVERSHPVYSAVLELGPRRSRTIELDLVEPDAGGAPSVPVQPLVRPQRVGVVVDPHGCAS